MFKNRIFLILYTLVVNIAAIFIAFKKKDFLKKYNETMLLVLEAFLLFIFIAVFYHVSGHSNTLLNDLKKISKIFPEDSKYYFVQSKVGRARDAKEVRDIFKLNNRCGDYYKSIENTINYVKGVSKENDIIFIGGSTFVVSEIFEKN